MPTIDDLKEKVQQSKRVSFDGKKHASKKTMPTKASCGKEEPKTRKNSSHSLASVRNFRFSNHT